MTRAKELAAMNDDELAHHLAESKEELFNLRFQLAMGKQDNSARLGQVKREVARTLTIQRQRQLGNPAGRREAGS
jgi:large subunit ribosomal protein L29